MLVPYRWLKDYIETDLPVKELAEKMVATGNGVEAITELGADIKNVVVGKIVKLEKHPDADKLQICQIDVGTETLQIVTGADNVFEGALVPVALCGSELPNGMKIKKGKLRGVESYGMLCSGEELCLKESDYPGAEVYGILILSGDWAPGTDIRKVIMKDDTVIEFEIGANRPDCLSVLGIAREAAAALDIPIKIPDAAYSEDKNDDIHNYVDVEVTDTDLCPRKSALRRTGCRRGSARRESGPSATSWISPTLSCWRPASPCTPMTIKISGAGKSSSAGLRTARP